MSRSIWRAAIIELARVGYDRLSMELVARRAGVGKAALYRRWSGKEAMIISLLTSVDLEIISASDRGTLAADVRDYLEKAFRLLGRPLSRRILPDLYAQMSRDSALASALRTVILEPKRKNVGQLLERAVRRGELSGDIDFDLAFDLIAGPIFWHALVSRTRAGEIFMDRLAESVTESLLTAGKPAPFLPSQTD